MTVAVITRRRKIGSRTKVKTGCATCRIRKVKCGEEKPFCLKCVNTGRSCDGYRSLFRLVASQPVKNADAKSDIGSHHTQPGSADFDTQEIELLNRYFSTKTILNVNLNCDEEAKQIIKASLTDASVRRAILSLKTLRADLEASGDSLGIDDQQTSNHCYGLQQYGMALGDLASQLTYPNANALKSALLCCQIFISIEQVRKNYTAMVQHVTQGLRIMHEYQARPGFIAPKKLTPAYGEQLPLLDVFVIKLFAAPCKFADAPAVNDQSGMAFSICPLWLPNSIEGCNLRKLAPDMRTELTRIASSTIEFLDKVSQIDSEEAGLRLLLQKADLLDSLNSWLHDLEVAQDRDVPEPVSVCFNRILYHILRIVVLGAPDSSPSIRTEINIETGRLQDIAEIVTERVKSYSVCSGTSKSGRSTLSSANNTNRIP